MISTQQYKELLDRSPDPAVTTLRLERLLEEPSISRFIRDSESHLVQIFINIIGISKFLFHYLCRHPQAINLLGSRKNQLDQIEAITDPADLRDLKYRELLRITSLDIAGDVAYEEILSALTQLADGILIRALSLPDIDTHNKCSGNTAHLALFGMGKLGAQELNYSSDVDLIFICANEEDITDDMYEYYDAIVKRIQRFTRVLEAREAHGYLYRVDMNLRPWGKSAPLVMPLNDTENYYEASTEAWERFAWLRARFIAGDRAVGMEMLQRLHSYRYRRSFGLNDLENFIGIKEEMQVIRDKPGSWNVKTGEGGIRDIEFFIQLLQIFNAGSHSVLQQTNTLLLLSSMVSLGLIDSIEADDIRRSYLFLRRLENRLQMIDEQQVHELPDEREKRLPIARSMGFSTEDADQTLKAFNQHLQQQRNIARGCFEKILLQKENM